MRSQKLQLGGGGVLRQEGPKIEAESRERSCCSW